MTRAARASGWFALLFAALACTACDGDLVTLGRAPSGAGGMPALSFGEPLRLVELSSPDKDDNATLTADLLHVYFTSTRGDNADVYHASRLSADQPFQPPELFEPGSDPERNDSSPAISLDGRSLWLGRELEGSAVDIWVTTTSDGVTWSELRNVAELNSPEDDIPRPPASQNRVMPLGSRRDGKDADYRTFLASRADESEPFGVPAPLPELESGARIVDGFLSEDLLMLFYSSGDGEDEGDLFVARRTSPDAPFNSPEPLTALNTDWDERDPWLSPDRSRIFFTSDRVDDNHDIFEASVTFE